MIIIIQAFIHLEKKKSIAWAHSMTDFVLGIGNIKIWKSISREIDKYVDKVKISF